MGIRRGDLLQMPERLVRRVFEDAGQGMPAGSINRTTTSFDPQINLTLDDARFAFTPPIK
jgi:hypothetical protein